jgi:hypothetical protein
MARALKTVAVVAGAVALTIGTAGVLAPAATATALGSLGITASAAAVASVASMVSAAAMALAVLPKPGRRRCSSGKVLGRLARG